MPLPESDSESSGTDATDIAGGRGRGRGRAGGLDRSKALVDKLRQANADLQQKLTKARRAATVARQNYRLYRARAGPTASGMTLRASTAAASANSGDAAVRPTVQQQALRAAARCARALGPNLLAPTYPARPMAPMQAV